MIERKSSRLPGVKSEIKPAQQQYGKLIVEMAKLEKRFPELVYSRPVELDAAIRTVAEADSIVHRSAHPHRDVNIRTRKNKKRYRIAASGRVLSAGKSAKTAANHGTKLGSYTPVPARRTVVNDAVNSVTTSLAAALRRDSNVDLTKISVPRLVQSMLRIIPRKVESNELADRVGPFYDTYGLRNWLGVSRQALEKKITSGKLLACVTSDRVRLYPVWQFTDRGTLLPGLANVLAALRRGTNDNWVIAAWLTTPVEELDGSAAEWLTDRRDPATVIELARHDAAAWAA